MVLHSSIGIINNFFNIYRLMVRPSGGTFTILLYPSGEFFKLADTFADKH